MLDLLGYFSSTHQPLATKRFILHLDQKTHPKTLNNYTPPKLTSTNITLPTPTPSKKINKNMELRLGRSQGHNPLFLFGSSLAYFSHPAEVAQRKQQKSKNLWSRSSNSIVAQWIGKWAFFLFFFFWKWLNGNLWTWRIFVLVQVTPLLNFPFGGSFLFQMVKSYTQSFQDGRFTTYHGVYRYTWIVSWISSYVRHENINKGNIYKYMYIHTKREPREAIYVGTSSGETYKQGNMIGIWYVICWYLNESWTCRQPESSMIQGRVLFS